jgi:uncharacterized protein with ParB-like and HNH nuclease domain
MRTDTYKLKDFLTDSNLEQIIIPEIQRDYVWTKDNVEKILKSILSNSERQKDASIPEKILDELNSDMKEAFFRLQKDKENYFNLGFIYAYNDTKMQYHYILVDGQQRITTIFLVLLALSVKENQQENFIRNYFKKREILKLDYKVREASHDFLLRFVKYILDGKNISDIKGEYWYFSEYQNDITIQSIINNYQVIVDFLDKNNISLDFVENHIEFLYFDIHKSKQGEELYLYMNSRGETVSPNESIKANLLKGKSDPDKHEWGEKWEDWQNLFWKNRNGNPNADKGIEEFLKWIKFIEIIKAKKNELARTKLDVEIKEINGSKKINSDGLSLVKIESYFNALKNIINYKGDLKFNLEWLAGNNNIKEYYILIPMLMYAEKYPDININIERFSRFFLNISRFETIEKGSTYSLVEIILLTDNFLEKNYTDITDIAVFADNFKSIITNEEKDKLSIYKQNPGDFRKEIEKAFWQAEDFKFCDGKIELIWDCIDFNRADISSFDNNKLSEFKDCFDNFKALFDKPTDWVRRALLTKGDYLVKDGYSNFLDQNRYSFIYEHTGKNSWKEQLTSNEKIIIYKSLIKDFGKRKKDDNSAETNDILKQIINDFLSEKNEKDWIYYFIKIPDFLDYCKEKRICGKDEDGIENITLLTNKRVANENFCKPLIEMIEDLKNSIIDTEL